MRLPPRQRCSDRGVTLVELLVVVAMIGVLVGATGPSMVQQLDSQKTAEARREILDIHQGMWGTSHAPGFIADIGGFPSTLS